MIRQDVAEPVARSTPEPLTEPAAEPLARSTPEPLTELATEPLARSTPEPLTEPATEPLARSTPEPVTQPGTRSIAEPAGEPFATPVVRSTTEPFAEPVARSTAEPVAGPRRPVAPGPAVPAAGGTPALASRLDRADSEVIAAFAGWAAGTGPLHRRLATGIRRAIENGALLPGERLPAERRLAGALRLSRTTVVTAYETLRGAGLIESRQGSGTRVADGPPPRPARLAGRIPGGSATEIFEHLIDGPSELISLSCSAEGAVPELRTALRELARGDLTALLADPGYHPAGLPELRDEIAAHLTRGGLPTAPGQILVTTGAQQALVLVAELYLRPGLAVLAETPSWPSSLDIFRSRHAGIRTVPLDGEGADAVAVAAALAAAPPALIHLMPTYHNPTGVLMSAARRRRIAEIAARHDVPIMEDNAYDAHTAGDGIPAPLAAYAPRGAEVLSVGSLAKSVWAGLRIGWVRGPAGVIGRLARRKALADVGSPVLDQALAARLLPRLPEIGAAQAPARETRLDLVERLLRDRIPGWRWRRPDGGTGLWVELPGVRAAEFAQVALRHGVEVVPGGTTDPHGGHQNFIRVPYTFPPEVIGRLVDRLAAAWVEISRHGPIDPGPDALIR
ncbi:hypothetical protein Sru01_58600 [Sphaerisporangium rufum]|uniref:HTH gntR-type domain-containing protein n=1 Tax=Sphaerisporangium rufum TaxID=1381558 RepID=A0A919V476_9ACTN|nr:aminotransferase class I/II-fold pyridoxal phosphate-dependent enzyme [Sphaerisporangium rufum]GII80878.1 hypothetical protein Sru01_58600 [Sphaerisporangium rufum]